MIVILLLIIACCMLFGANKTKNFLSNMFLVICVILMFASCAYD